jgi:hypothetical protein
MASIGGISFIRMAGPKIPSALPVVQTIDRQGVDLSAFRLQAYKNAEITVQTTQAVASATLANLAPDAYAALIGTKVTVVDDLDLTTLNVMVIDARVIRTQLTAATAPTGTAALVMGIWILRPTTL